MTRLKLAFLCAMLAFSPIQTILAVEAGVEVPNCALTAIDNTQQSYGLKQFRGKVLFVDFWSSWCNPCVQSFSLLNEMNRDLKDKGLQVIGINLDEVPEDAKAFLAKHPASFTVVADANQQCAKDFDVKAMPSSYLIDRNGVIRYVHLGFRPGEAKEFRALAEQLLAENPVRK
ncbi:MAG: redoxin [Candidatus Methylumidiphilus alinenensis]|uniref:Redoxin n=1 Tax=Candidatus Methylumidiphilus alinenensis TaxID=2202197 RepID=A0A2W4RSG4_9GAMM|nr:MAG: redoxin [Candidatus Methylumidiphilus alinenensis]